MINDERNAELRVFFRTSNSSGAAAAGAGGSKRLAQQQAQVDEVVDIMRQNVDKVLERDKNLSLLDDRAGAKHFSVSKEIRSKKSFVSFF